MRGAFAMACDIKYSLGADGLSFHAECDGRHIGEITFVRVGIDKFIVDHTAVDMEYRNAGVGLNLVRMVSDLARRQRRKIIPLCPFTGAMFGRYAEFDDVRFLRAG